MPPLENKVSNQSLQFQFKKFKNLTSMWSRDGNYCGANADHTEQGMPSEKEPA